MLAIATPSFGKPSETFIHDHVRSIAPGRTVLLCYEGPGTEAAGCPTLVLPPPTLRRQIVRRAASVLGHAWSGRAGPAINCMTRDNRERSIAFLREAGVRAMLAEYGPTGVDFAPVAEAVGIPLFVHFHGYDASMMLRDWRTVVRYRELFGQAAGIVAPSRFLAARLEAVGCPPERMHVNPYGVDPAAFVPARPEPFRLLCVGRLVEKKAPHLSIEAFARVAARFPEASLDIVGAGPLERRCRRLIARHKLSDRVRLRGALDNSEVAQLMARSALFLQHSVTAPSGDTEGLGITLLEAMATGIPIVVTRHNGFPETVLDGVTGLLVEEHDVDGMAAAIADLLSDAARARAMGAAGRERVRTLFDRADRTAHLREILGISGAVAT